MTFIEEINAIDNGRFTEIAKAVGVKEECGNCGYFDYNKKDKYRCCGDCLGCLVSDKTKSYLLWKLGRITDKEHMTNLGLNEKA